MIDEILMTILSKKAVVVEKMVVYPSVGKEYALVEIYPNKNRRTTEIIKNYEEQYGVIVTLNTVYIDRNKEFYKLNNKEVIND